jgi:hypothetical protein
MPDFEHAQNTTARPTPDHIPTDKRDEAELAFEIEAEGAEREATLERDRQHRSADGVR